MKRYIAAVVMMVLSLQCTKQDLKTYIILENAVKCMEHYPDSSLAILNTLNLKNLPTQKEKARYALLKSIALDKNYIDVTSDSLTSIALTYYKKHGTSDEKLKTCYYNGVICRNKGDIEGEMSNYIQAEKFVKGSSDYVYVGRLYNAKMMVYKETFNVEKALEPAELSARYYLKGKDTVRFITALNNLSSMLLATNKYDSLLVCFSKLQENKRYMTPKQLSNYYVNLINYKTSIADSTLCENIREYLSYFKNDESLIKWHTIADAFFKSGDVLSALAAIENYKIYGNISASGISHHIASEIYSSTGNYQEAYEHLKIFQEVSIEKDYKALISDTKFLEERYMAQIQQLKQQNLIILLSSTVILAFIGVIYLCKYFRNQNRRRILKIQEIEEQREQLANEYENSLAEQEKLRTIISDQSLNPKIKILLEQRLAILNKFIVSNISGVNMEKSVKELRQFLTKDEEFLQSTRMTFEITHPKFISFLESKGLSKREIEYCCLYCIGLNGNEISNFLNLKYFYKNSFAIRKKLDVQSVNIDTFLKNKMRELYQ